jgi:phospholipid/cholesterol/gamma-HCH transport system substrate-binding protein
MIAIAAAIWASLTGGGTSILQSKSEFICYFKNVSGLLRGSPIWMSGVEVGNVKSVSFVSLDSLRKVKVTCRIRSSVWGLITEGTGVQLGTIGILGDKYIEIVRGPDDTPVMLEGVVLPTLDVGSADRMFARGEEAMGQVGSLVGNLDDFMARINRAEGTLGKIATQDDLHDQVTELLAQLSQLTAELTISQARLTEAIERTSNNVASLTSKVENNSGTIGRLMSDPKLYDNLAATSARLDSVMQCIQASDGSLGLLVNDTALYVETVNLLQRVNALVTDIEENPGDYFKFSLF